jgi:serine protease
VGAQSWLTVSAQTVDADGLGSYRASVDRSAVAEGTYTATITFTTTAGAADVSVLMQRFTATSTDDAGTHYIQVFDPETLTSVASGTATAGNGRYDYRVSDVPFGEYLIYAGSNFDNDADICDPGEACGAYLSLDQPNAVRVDSDKTGIDFATGFDLSFGAANLNEISDSSTNSPDRGLSTKRVFTP